MATIRQEKIARIIKESVSDTIANHLNDPRICGIVSVTQVSVSADLRNADVQLSIMADSEKVRKRTFQAINGASRRIRKLLGQSMTSRFCPRLRFHEDSSLKNTMQTLKLIDQAAKEYEEKLWQETEEEPQDGIREK